MLQCVPTFEGPSRHAFFAWAKRCSLQQVEFDKFIKTSSLKSVINAHNGGWAFAQLMITTGHQKVTNDNQRVLKERQIILMSYCQLRRRPYCTGCFVPARTTL